MLSVHMTVILALLVGLAGFIDSIAGGGGLVSLTSLYAFGLAPVAAVSTNKFAMSFGTLFAFINYTRNKVVVWKIALPGVVFALIGSSIGSQLALSHADTALRYMLLIVLPVMTILTLRKKGGGGGSALIRREGEGFAISASSYLVAAIATFAIGIYDGFFGPGTGTFLTILFSFMGLPMIYSAGTTKVVNLASNVAAFTTFVVNGSVVFSVGIPCAVTSILGNLLGSSWAVKGEGKAIRKLLVVVIALLYVKIVVEFII